MLHSLFKLEGESVKKFIGWFLAFFLLGWIVGLASPDEDLLSRLHPALRAIVSTTRESGDESMWLRSLLGSDRYKISRSLRQDRETIGVLVQLRQTYTGHQLADLPVEVNTGTILGLTLTVEELLRLLEERDDVVYVEPTWKTRLSLDRSLPAIHANSVHVTVPPVVGEGVIVGTVDTGIDYTHLDFRLDSDGDGFEESSRILAILDQTWGLFGAEYSREQIEADLAQGFGPDEGDVRQIDIEGHGTHVASIAAGDGSSSSFGFVGVAPEAWIVAVKTTFYTADILRGVEYIFDLADSLDLPAVVNLSLGGHEGPHDGTSLFEQGLDELVQESGHVIVVSAGNEGDLPIHVSTTLLGGTSSFEVVPDDWEVELSLWYPGSSQFTISVSPPTDSPIVVPRGVNSGVVVTADGMVRIDNASSGANPNNGDHEVFIRWSSLSGGDSWRVTVSDAGGGGRFDAWITSGTGTILGGDSARTIDEPGNARGVITVGSFNSKASWPSLSGDQNYSAEYPIGVLSSFSSQGPTRDGRTKPEIGAPGAWICASLSEDALWQGYLVHPDGVHTMELGTSMAAPHVTGAAALLLSLDPTLSSMEVRQILTSTAVQDVFTGTVPNARWGWGKLHVAAAVESVEVSEPPDEIPDATALPKISLEANPVADRATFIYDIAPETLVAILRIYNVFGVPVYETTVAPSSSSYEWSLQTDRGGLLASGLYLYVLVTDLGTSEVGKLVIAR